VIYGLLRQWDPPAFRATLQSYFLPTGLLIIAGHGISGLWTRTVFTYYGLSFPAVLLALWLGNKLHNRLPAGRFNKSVYFLLIGVALLLIVRIII